MYGTVQLMDAMHTESVAGFSLTILFMGLKYQFCGVLNAKGWKHLCDYSHFNRFFFWCLIEYDCIWVSMLKSAHGTAF